MNLRTSQSFIEFHFVLFSNLNIFEHRKSDFSFKISALLHIGLCCLGQLYQFPTLYQCHFPVQRGRGQKDEKTVHRYTKQRN